MRPRWYTLENLLYGLAFLLALSLRLFRLGAAPLNDIEASWALQALWVHNPVAPLGAQPAYIILTGQLFSLFGSTVFLARFFPALAGSLLTWLPILFRRSMGTSAWLQRFGLVMAFGLALDPGLVALSRQVGSQMPALAFTLLALACLHNRRMLFTGIFAALAVLSGPAFLQGLLILAVTWGLYQLVNNRDPQPSDRQGELSPESILPIAWQAALFAFAATLFIAGTLFLSLPQGLSGLANTLPAYAATWLKPSGVPPLRLPASLLIYQPLVVIFSMAAVLRLLLGKWDHAPTRPLGLGLSLWAGVALLLPLMYTGRLVGDMAWALIPMWALAATEISRSLAPDEEKTSLLFSAGLGVLLFVLAVVGWIYLLTIGRYQTDVAVYWVTIIGSLLLGFIAILLVATTWSTSSARLGVVWALCLVLGLQLFSNTWGLAVLRPNAAQELWSTPLAAGQADRLLSTLADLSSRNTGLEDQLEIVSLVDSPALQWALRGFPNARFESLLSATESPQVVITTKDSPPPSLAEAYRGQDFIWQQSPGWPGSLPPGFINWLSFRQAPLNQSQVILWARADIFPGGSIGTAENTQP